MTYRWLNTPKDARTVINGAVENIGMLLFVNTLAKNSPNAETLLSESVVERLILASKELHDIAMEIDNGN